MSALEPHIIDLDIGGLRLRIAAPADFDALLDRCAATHPADVNMIPYYAQLWPSARALARFLALRPNEVRGRRVVELGCGLGLPSMVAARLGADVTAVDFHPDNGAWFLRNCALNGVTAGYVAGDWSTLPERRDADVVMGSDLLYERHAPASLTQAAARLLSPGGRILLADPGRDPLQPAIDAFRALGYTEHVDVIDDVFLLQLYRERTTDEHADSDGPP